MKILVFCPGKIPASRDKIQCFTDVINYYLPAAIKLHVEADVVKIPSSDTAELQHIFSSINVDNYNAIVTLGLRFYSKISSTTTCLLRDRFSGLFCQTYDGSRLDIDPVDITFTFKNDDLRMQANPNWYKRHKLTNEYIGWAADPELNSPAQDLTDLRILVDHTNYGDNTTDNTLDVILQIKNLIDSNIWREYYKTISVRRFDSGKVVDVDFTNLQIEKYDRSPIPFTEITKEHGKAHIFMVTHPESVGLVVLETSLAGALTVTPNQYIPDDRLETIRHYKYDKTIDWQAVLKLINPKLSREIALVNTWDRVALNNRIT